MRRHLHHLNALRCFEAAARQLSFTQAAAELHVTQAAVSHQVRALEQALGQPLFERRPRQVRLTAAGERLVGVLSSSFDRIDELLGQLKQGSRQTQSLQLAVTPSFSGRWLMPRLPRFWDAHPEVELHLHHSTQPDALARGTAEAAVAWLREPPPRLWAQRLFGTALSPVCAPTLPRPEQPLESPEALRDYPLLHEDSFDDWARWLRAAGVAEGGQQRQGQLIDDSNALLLAAMAGRGLALGRLALIEDELRAGRLLRPFALSIEADGAYWLLAAPALAEQPRFRALADFMLGECPAG
ncbi:LysR substrate-binding domain-containing protein [Roseateles cavernae]|uniref:LysR substrate-binding domain-containing protein n=1 Tax=Roseateles cavernae TaxID=3153578 RepID=UPI0032E48A7A